jgi:hypothetical protein
MKYIVTKKETTFTTKIFEIEVEPDGRTYPSMTDRAISATSDIEPIATDTSRHFKYIVMERREISK